MCVKNVLFRNIPSYTIDGPNILVLKAVYNVVNESQMNALLVRIGYSQQLLGKWMYCTSPLDKAYVNNHPLAVGILPTLYKFPTFAPYYHLIS